MPLSTRNSILSQQQTRQQRHPTVFCFNDIQQTAPEWALPTLMTIASVAILGTLTYSTYRVVRRYGVDGTLRYIWEGTPYQPNVQEQMETLDDIDSALLLLNTNIADLESSLERAQQSIQGSYSAILLQWECTASCTDLRKHLAIISYDLDQLAARADAVPSSGQEEVKIRKKDTSARIVKLMDRADALISFYTKASSPSG
jgi:hypothetical protein